MASPFTFPPTGFGPGSQPDPEGDVQYAPMPSGMRTYAPHIPEAADPVAMVEAMGFLARLAEVCEAVAAGGAVQRFDLTPLSSNARVVVIDALGQGEVSLRIRGLPAVRAQESIFAGVWMLQAVGLDAVEVAPIPALALSRAHLPHRPMLGTAAPGLDGSGVEGLANAPALLTELADHAARYAPGDAPHVVNLTLLPHTPADLAWLDSALGEGAVTILSRGYGNCRITSAAMAHVWRVQFFNSQDTLILDTFEVTLMPEVALAAPEDLADSAVRIRDTIEAIR